MEQMTWGEMSDKIFDGEIKPTLENFLVHVDDDESFLMDEALAYLIHQEVCFINFRPYAETGWADDDKEKWIYGSKTVVVFVALSDVFSWASSDAECLESENDIRTLLESYLKDSRYGVILWVCKKRKEQPQKALIEMMKKEGAWDDEMEALPSNKVDARIHAATK